MTPSFDYKDDFPFDKPREQQLKAIEFAIDEFFKNDKKFLILEMGTGCGKSAIAIALSNYIAKNRHSLFPQEAGNTGTNRSPGTYILTTQKVLQDQYEKDFGEPKGKLVSLKSSRNYTCRFDKKISCGEGKKLIRNLPQNSPQVRQCKFNCKYNDEKNKFKDSNQGITNFSFFLTSSMYTDLIKRKDFLIIDEAHNTDSELSNFINITISEFFATKFLKLKMPPTEKINTKKRVLRWIKTVYLPALAKKAKLVSDKIDNLKASQKSAGISATIRIQKDILSNLEELENLKGYFDKIKYFLEVYNDDNWVMNIVSGPRRGTRKFEFKVIDVSSFTEKLLFKFGNKVLLMSATIVNIPAFCKLLGINENDVSSMSVESPFPDNNRPIFYVPVGKMTRNEIDKTLPKMADAVKKILEHHKDEKGIIHTNTYKIAQYLKEHVKDKRLLVPTSKNREAMLKRHIKSKKPTILVSPSMTEGVDLPNDTSRFQVLCKIPYPYLGDQLCKKRMRKWDWWYPLQTTKTIIQSTGRSIRNEKDFAVTYILDEEWERFSSRNRKIIPQHFLKLLVK